MTREPLTTLPFTKMHGAGNDFVVLDGIGTELPPLEAFAQRLGDRNFGVGCDQILVARLPRDTDAADFRMEIYNRDGSQVEMCGNGIRAFFKFLRDRGYTTADELRIETLGGVVRPRWVRRDNTKGDMVRVDMGRPILAAAKIPTTLATGDGPVLDVTLTFDRAADLQPVTLSCASMGNPHAVVVVPDVETAPVAELGSAIGAHPAFPAGANVEFIEILDRGHVRQRTWERGAGETLACGSGACAVGVVSMLRGAIDREVKIELRGGDLEIAWQGGDSHVFMTGPAVEVFTGFFPLSAAE